MKPDLRIDTSSNNIFMKHAMFRHTQSGSIDFIQKSWKVGATGLKERTPNSARSMDPNSPAAVFSGSGLLTNGSSTSSSTVTTPLSAGGAAAGTASASGASSNGNSQQDEKIHPFHQTTIQPSDIKILKELGTGGSATVHLISYKNQQYALKVINLDDLKHQFKSAQSEIETLRRLQNNYVVQMRQAYIRNRRIAIILDYCNCTSLYEAYKKCNRTTQRCSFGKRGSEQVRGVSNLEVLASIASQALLGLMDMHRNSICHRDIKPSNLLLHSHSSTNGVVKITDFGLARLLQPNELCTEIIGTAKYHSPERLAYQTYGPAADIWSLGVSIAETFLGRYPFNQVLEPCPEDEFRRFLCGEPLKHESFPSHLFPADLLKFVSACMERDPERRPTPEQLLQFNFLKHAKNEEHSRQVLGKWIEETRLKLPPVSNPVSIRTSTPRGRRASMAKQFFSMSSDDGDTMVSMSFGTPTSSSLYSSNQHFQNMSLGDSLRGGSIRDHAMGWGRSSDSPVGHDVSSGGAGMFPHFDGSSFDPTASPSGIYGHGSSVHMNHGATGVEPSSQSPHSLDQHDMNFFPCGESDRPSSFLPRDDMDDQMFGFSFE